MFLFVINLHFSETSVHMSFAHFIIVFFIVEILELFIYSRYKVLDMWFANIFS